MTEVQRPLIVAVSGGIDSAVLLHMLVSQGKSLIVAHVDHGIRSDSAHDLAFVRDLAAGYRVSFYSTNLRLGQNCSEDRARVERYAWLERLMAEQNAAAIVTAHHQDDLIETTIINLIRGTGWRGLASLRTTVDRQRPLLHLTKAEIVQYAIEHGLEWHEDSTNDSMRILRNKVRQGIVPRLSIEDRQRLVSLCNSQQQIRQNIEAEEAMLVEKYGAKSIPRHLITMSDHLVGVELLRAWTQESFEQNRFYDLLLFAKVAKNGAKWPIDGGRFIKATTRSLIVLPPRD